MDGLRKNDFKCPSAGFSGENYFLAIGAATLSSLQHQPLFVVAMRDEALHQHKGIYQVQCAVLL